ncbi:MAG: hypothetical protein V1772_06140 [Chloroflexota bacterium]
MPNGLDHVQAALGACQRMLGSLEQGSALAASALEAGVKADLAARLGAMQATLTVVQERFFLRSKLCLPYAARCEREAAALEAALGQGAALGPALEALDRAVKVLDERSNMQGMAIT